MLEQLPKILEESRRQVERALNSPLKLRAQVSEIVYPNAKDGALFAQVVREDSALGEQCGSVADFAKGTTAKVANLPQNPQSSHSPTANLRILEEENRSGFEKSARNDNNAAGGTPNSLESHLATTRESTPTNSI